MVLQKEELWQRVRVRSVWIGPAQRTPLFPLNDVTGTADEHMAGTAAVPIIAEDQMRYIISLLFQGNAIVHQSLYIEKRDEAGNFHMKWSDVQVAPAAMPQIPEGSYDLENPIIALEGGTNLYGTVNGNSINLTITYWDWGV